jgi:hypothetical protein
MSSDDCTLLKAIEQGIEHFYQSCQLGRDVSPAQQYRLEGMIAAALLINVCSEDDIQQLKKHSFSTIFNREPNGRELGDATELFLVMNRAPVYPST